MTTYRQPPVVNVSARNILDSLLVAGLALSPVVIFILFLVL